MFYLFLFTLWGENYREPERTIQPPLLGFQAQDPKFLHQLSDSRYHRQLHFFSSCERNFVQMVEAWFRGCIFVFLRPPMALERGFVYAIVMG